MLTRLRVKGFKNLVDVDVRFGPFTCIAGPNGLGKSNLFDAIQFLSLLAEHPLLDAARRVRGGGRPSHLFHRTGEERAEEIALEAEMIVPQVGKDDLGQRAVASSTLLQYRLRLGLAKDQGSETLDRLQLLEEYLGYIKKGDAHKHLLFEHSARGWRDSVILNNKKGEGFISTHEEGGSAIVRLHQDGGGSRGRPLSYLASTLPRTVLSSTNAAESPTALLARREMQSWRLLQMEPSALRRSDTLDGPARIGSDGSHLAATLYRLEQSAYHFPSQTEGPPGELVAEPASGHFYAEVANRLATFLDDVREIDIDRDEKRELLTLLIRTSAGTEFPAPALSDGSLRFLALTILEIDPEATGVLCLEEPENGVHPKRIPAMIDLLQRIAVDPSVGVDDSNPLRQVIVNTHSPAVVQWVPPDSLLLAVPAETFEGGRHWLGVGFRPLSGSWRAKAEGEPSRAASLGELLGYLNPSPWPEPSTEERPRDRVLRVADREDVQALLPFGRRG